MKKRNKGITLIALVITIIILLILAAVSINLLVGENGILNRAQTGATEYQRQAGKEKLELKVAGIDTDKLGKELRHATLAEIKAALDIDNEVESTRLESDILYVILVGYPFEYTVDRNLIIGVNGIIEDNGDNTSQKAYDIGEIFWIDDQGFYVIEKSEANNSKVKGIAINNIWSEDEVTFKQNTSGSQNSENTISFSETNYWAEDMGDADTFNLNTYKSVDPTNTFNIMFYAKKYAEDLGATPLGLLTLEQAETFGVDVTLAADIGDQPGNVPSWIAGDDTYYWLATASGKNTIYSMYENVLYCSDSYDESRYSGIRPVLEIEKSKLVEKYNKPTISNSLQIADGTNKSPTIVGFDPSVMNQTGTTSATSVGTYTITWSLKNKNTTAWKDGTKDDVTVTWKIVDVLNGTPITIAVNSASHYGDKVNYTVAVTGQKLLNKDDLIDDFEVILGNGYDEQQEEEDPYDYWRVFYNDGNKVTLIYGGMLVGRQEQYNDGNLVGIYKPVNLYFGGRLNPEYVEKLSDTSYWAPLLNGNIKLQNKEECKAMGAVDIETFVASWNAKGYQQLNVSLQDIEENGKHYRGTNYYENNGSCSISVEPYLNVDELYTPRISKDVRPNFNEIMYSFRNLYGDFRNANITLNYGFYNENYYMYNNANWNTSGEEKLRPIIELSSDVFGEYNSITNSWDIY